MYCPRCGGANDDTARFLQRLRSGLGPVQRGVATDRRDRRGALSVFLGQPTGQGPVYQQPPYQQHYQPAYQPPSYQPAGGYRAIPHIPSYMGWAIAVLILCFWPTGIAAVVYASQVGNKLAVGDVAGAQESSRKAKMWCWVSFGIAIAGIVLAILIWIFVAAAAFTIY